VPANVVATAVSSSRIDITWGASPDSGGSGLSGYRIYRGATATALATVAAPATSYADTDLVASTQYSYVIRAFDGAGNESPASAFTSATTQANPSASASGLDARPSNDSCVAWARPQTGTISLQRFTSLSFASATAMVQAPNDDSAWYVLEQGGTIRRFVGANATESSQYGSVDVVSGGEQGLLGMAFHPDFPIDNRVFLSYTRVVGGQRVLAVSSFASTPTALGSTENVLLRINKPTPTHNGGNIAFGPDGYLYIGVGDGGGAGDDFGSNGNGQRLTTLLGKMLRIDIDGNMPYVVPPSNPFYSAINPADRCPPQGRDSGNCPEIYAWGFRNPWRWSFDRENGDLWVGDVGQGTWEEASVVTLGGNYGWRCREGAHDFNSANTPLCANASPIDPVTEYSNSRTDVAITGGFVYRGQQDTPLRGRYIFGDYGSGIIRAWISEAATQPRQPTQLLDSNVLIPSFAEGNDGELYVVASDSLQRIRFQPPATGNPVPTSLSDTGCVNPADPRQPASGLIPYAINAPFWSDGATKNRWLALPNGSKITVQESGDWDFPNGTVLMKNFTLESQLIESRLFMRHSDEWAGYTYAWNAQQTDATLVQGGAVRAVGGQQWIYPSEGECVQCHTSAAGGALGLETAQLNRSFLYPQTGRTANELFTLNHIQLLTPPVTDPPAQPRIPDPADGSAPLEQRARAWLHTNCSQCHRPGGPTPSTMDLRYTTGLNQTGACNATALSGDLGIGAAARLIAPGSAANSVIVNRISRRDANAMPPVGLNVLDTAGVTLLTQWINGLSGC
jgi:uncharacterized repeat protein (TIGR03806 family)